MVFTWVDILFVLLIIFSVAIGLMRGFFREISALIIWVLAFFIAGYFAENQAWLSSVPLTPSMRAALVFVVVFLIVMVLGFLLRRLCNTLVKKSEFGLLNNGLGALLGFVRGLVIVLMIIFVVDLTQLANDSVWQSATTVRLGQAGLNAITQMPEVDVPAKAG